MHIKLTMAKQIIVVTAK